MKNPLFLGMTLLLLPWLGGCASLAEGVTKGLFSSGVVEEEPLMCEVTGPAFQGLASPLRQQEEGFSSTPENSQVMKKIKVMFVHGMGSPKQGFSARLQSNLLPALGLTIRDRRSKVINLTSSDFESEPLGKLTVWRYFNEERTKEVLFYELLWSEIVDKEKQELAYDTYGQQAFKRANVNHIMKKFLNSSIADPIIYGGPNHDKILESVRQGQCWMLFSDWNELPDLTTQACGWKERGAISDITDSEFFFVTHSMGSRVVIDAFQQGVRNVAETLMSDLKPEDRNLAEQILAAFRNKELHVFMMANQLPLMQLGRSVPDVVGQTGDYCREDGKHYKDRLYKKLVIVAFSDPNDVLSYAISPEYEDKYMDSRLCPSLVNVSINITPATDLLGIGEIANPYEAHVGYDNDDRVIALMMNGIGNDQVADIVATQCTWLQTVEE